MNPLHRYFTLVVSAVFVASLVGCMSGRPFGERVADQAIETKVKLALIDAPDVNGNSIEVEVRNGDVQLSGFVRSHREVARAIEIARGVEGVRSVINALSVQT